MQKLQVQRPDTRTERRPSSASSTSLEKVHCHNKLLANKKLKSCLYYLLLHAMVLMWSSGIGLLVFGGILNRTDLYIFGGIFTAGGTLFITMDVIYGRKKSKIHAAKEQQLEMNPKDAETPTTLTPAQHQHAEKFSDVP